ncbi:hypothetical protein ACB092_02G030100 [Castanea dentata]
MKKIEEPLPSNVKSKIIRRGMSLGPSEILIGARARQKPEITPLQNIDELKETKERDGEKLVKKPVKPGRVVASRYNQIANQSNGNLRLSDGRKRSLPENDKDDGKRCNKRVKKQWEIPSEVMVYKGEEDGNVASISKVGGVLPKIRSLRCVNETPRDLGPAKRVAELIGRRSFFCNNEEVEPSVCQALSFAEGDAEEE